MLSKKGRPVFTVVFAVPLAILLSAQQSQAQYRRGSIGYNQFPVRYQQQVGFGMQGNFNTGIPGTFGTQGSLAFQQNAAARVQNPYGFQSSWNFQQNDQGS